MTIEERKTWAYLCCKVFKSVGNNYKFVVWFYKFHNIYKNILREWGINKIFLNIYLYFVKYMQHLLKCNILQEIIFIKIYFYLCELNNTWCCFIITSYFNNFVNRVSWIIMIFYYEIYNSFKKASFKFYQGLLLGLNIIKCCLFCIT